MPGEDRLLSEPALALVAVALGALALALSITVPRLLTGGFLLAPLMILPTATLGVVSGVYAIRLSHERRHKIAGWVGSCASVSAIAVTAAATVVWS